jgi:predicted GNAT family acetyltransferase
VTAPKPAPGQAELVLRDNVDRDRYEITLAENGTRVAIITYRRSDVWIALLHTGVETAFEGQGMGSRSARLVFADARERGLKIIPKCPFILRWLERHPEEHDILLRPLPSASPDDGAPPAGSPLDMS